VVVVLLQLMMVLVLAVGRPEHYEFEELPVHFALSSEQLQ
jgi:hypothetical protein